MIEGCRKSRTFFEEKGGSLSFWEETRDCPQSRFFVEGELTEGEEIVQLWMERMGFQPKGKQPILPTLSYPQNLLPSGQKLISMHIHHKPFEGPAFRMLELLYVENYMPNRRSSYKRGKGAYEQ